MSGSIFVNFIIRLFQLLNHWYENSLVYQLSKRLAAYCGGRLILQGFYRLIAGESGIRFTEGSLVIRFFDKIGHLVQLLLKKFHDFARPLAEGSLILKVMRWEGITLSCLRPEVFLSLFVLFIAVVPAEYWRNIFILLAALFLAVLYFWKEFLDRGLHKIPSALLLYLCFAFVGLFQSPVFSDSLRVLSIFIPCVCITLLIQNIINTPEKLDFVLGSVLLGVFLTAMYGFYQYKAGIEVRADWVDLVASQGLRRVFSTMGNPNNYAVYLVLFLPLCFAYAMNRKTELQKLCAFALMAPGFLALALTASRASYLVAVGAAGLFVLLLNKRLVPFFILCFLGLIPFLPASIVNRVLTIGADTSSKYRVMIWEASLQILKNFWVGGIGMGPEAFKKIYRIYSHPDAYNAMHAHNLFLQLWIENGIFAFIAFMVFYLGLIKKLLSSCMKPFTGGKSKINYPAASCEDIGSTPPRQAARCRTGSLEMRNYLISYICALAALAVFGMVEYVWFYPRVMLSFWVVAGLALATLRLEENK